MNTVLFAGYPRSGNTLLGQTLNHAGGIHGAPYDIYQLRRERLTPSPNPIFRSEICSIKTHDSWRPFRDFHSLYFGSVLKVVVITRNPFDTLLSSINFFRILYLQGGNELSPLARYSLTKLIPDFQIKNSFLADFKLAKLRDGGMLDIALQNFGESGTVISNFYTMTGTWSDFSSSYDYSGVDVLKISYEELEAISIRSAETNDYISPALSKLSSFLDVDSALLRKGFSIQRRDALAIKEAKSEVKFFNEGSSGYWKNYFSAKACRSFMDLHYPAIARNGYEHLISEID